MLFGLAVLVALVVKFHFSTIRRGEEWSGWVKGRWAGKFSRYGHLLPLSADKIFVWHFCLFDQIGSCPSHSRSGSETSRPTGRLELPMGRIYPSTHSFDPVKIDNVRFAFICCAEETRREYIFNIACLLCTESFYISRHCVYVAG